MDLHRHRERHFQQRVVLFSAVLILLNDLVAGKEGEDLVIQAFGHLVLLFLLFALRHH